MNIGNMPEMDFDKYEYTFGPIPNDWDKKTTETQRGNDKKWCPNVGGVHCGILYRRLKPQPEQEPPETIELKID